MRQQIRQYTTLIRLVVPPMFDFVLVSYCSFGFLGFWELLGDGENRAREEGQRERRLRLEIVERGEERMKATRRRRQEINSAAGYLQDQSPKPCQQPHGI